jgi:hypothetical protein
LEKGNIPYYFKKSRGSSELIWEKTVQKALYSFHERSFVVFFPKILISESVYSSLFRISPTFQAFSVIFGIFIKFEKFQFGEFLFC